MAIFKQFVGSDALVAPKRGPVLARCMDEMQETRGEDEGIRPYADAEECGKNIMLAGKCRGGLWPSVSTQSPERRGRRSLPMDTTMYNKRKRPPKSFGGLLFIHFVPAL